MIRCGDITINSDGQVIIADAQRYVNVTFRKKNGRLMEVRRVKAGSELLFCCPYPRVGYYQWKDRVGRRAPRRVNEDITLYAHWAMF